jgi:hypothetical protein
MPTTYVQGQQIQGGTVNYDANTGKLLGAGQSTTIDPSYKPSTIINGSNLGVQPTQVPPPVYNTTSQTNLGVTGGNIVGGAMNETAQLNQPQPENKQNSILESIKNLIGVQETKGAYISGLQSSQDVAGKTQALNDINNKITLTSQSYDQQLKDLSKNSQGTFAGGLEIKTNDLTRKKNEDLANLGILKSVALNDLNTANQIVADKVAAKFEPIESNIQNLQNLFQLQQNDLTESEQLQVQAQIQSQQKAVEDLKNTYGLVLQQASQNGAPPGVLAAIDKAASDPNATQASIYASAGQYGVDKSTQLDNQYKQAQIDKIYNDISSSGTTEDPANILAYAQQYASTGTIPTGMPKGTFGIMAQAAKELPKQDGSLVDTNTGVKSGKLSPTQEDGISALFDLSKKLTDLSSVYATSSTSRENQIVYSALRNEIVDLLARARTGAAISASEEALYKNKIPGTSKGIFTYNSPKKITGLQSSLQGKLNTMLNTNGLSLYGYSKVNIQGTDYTVGTIITNDAGDKGRVNPDGTITLIQ